MSKTASELWKALPEDQKKVVQYCAAVAIDMDLTANWFVSHTWMQPWKLAFISRKRLIGR